MAEDTDFYNIVVVGAMNPSIHHPGWYQLVGLISEEEAQEAYSSKVTFCTPPWAKLETGGMTIICQEGRWEIQTRDAEILKRVRHIAAEVFDTLLKHTPVNTFGFNFNFQRNTNCANVPELLAGRVAALGIGLPNDKALAGEVVLRRGENNQVVSTVVKPGPTPSSITVATNYNYPLAKIKGFFSLADRFDQRLDSDLEEARSQVARTVETINSM